MTTAPIRSLFLDIGGVLLTNGWDRAARQQAARTFHLNTAELDERHHQAFDSYEVGKLTLDEYLRLVVFYEPRPFTADEFKSFMFSRSQPFPAMLDLIRDLKTRGNLKTVAVSNEGRELASHRTEQFNLTGVFDIFVVSAFVHLRKPDPEIYRLALDVAQVPREQIVYIEDRPVFVEMARSLGIRSIQHTGYQATRAALQSLGLPVATAASARTARA